MLKSLLMQRDIIPQRSKSNPKSFAHSYTHHLYFAINRTLFIQESIVEGIIPNNSTVDEKKGIIYLIQRHIDGTVWHSYSGEDTFEAAPLQAKSRLGHVFLHELSHFVQIDAEKNFPEIDNYYKNVAYNKYWKMGPYRNIFHIDYGEFLAEDINSYFFRGRALTQIQPVSDFDLKHYGFPRGPAIIEISDTLAERERLLHELKIRYSVSDRAMNITYSKKSKSGSGIKKGGIDLTPANNVLQTQNAGEAIKFHLNPAQLAQLQNAPGFVPVIINIQPLKNISKFLGVAQNTP